MCVLHTCTESQQVCSSRLKSAGLPTVEERLLVDSEIDLSTRYGKTRVFMNRRSFFINRHHFLLDQRDRQCNVLRDLCKLLSCVHLLYGGLQASPSSQLHQARLEGSVCALAVSGDASNACHTGPPNTPLLPTQRETHTVSFCLCGARVCLISD
jgi:hypothetical protein